MVTQFIAFWFGNFGPLMLAALLIGFLAGAKAHGLRAQRHVYAPDELDAID